MLGQKDLITEVYGEEDFKNPEPHIHNIVFLFPTKILNYDWDLDEKSYRTNMERHIKRMLVRYKPANEKFEIDFEKIVSTQPVKEITR